MRNDRDGPARARWAVRVWCAAGAVSALLALGCTDPSPPATLDFEQLPRESRPAWDDLAPPGRPGAGQGIVLPVDDAHVAILWRTSCDNDPWKVTRLELVGSLIRIAAERPPVTGERGCGLNGGPPLALLVRLPANPSRAQAVRSATIGVLERDRSR
jgi:hypothetical protein